MRGHAYMHAFILWLHIMHACHEYYAFVRIGSHTMLRMHEYHACLPCVHIMRAHNLGELRPPDPSPQAGGLRPPWTTPPARGCSASPDPPGGRLRQHVHAESQMKYNEILLPFHCYFRCYFIAISLLIHC